MQSSTFAKSTNAAHSLRQQPAGITTACNKHAKIGYNVRPSLAVHLNVLACLFAVFVLLVNMNFKCAQPCMASLFNLFFRAHMWDDGYLV